MNGTRDADEANAPDADGGLDPREAAALLELTKRQARRQFESQKPLTMLLQAAAVFGIYGAIWLSVRGQHPYQGPSLGVIGLVYSIVVVAAIVASVSRRRANAGVSGRTRRDEQLIGIAIAVPWIAVYVFMGALRHDGFDHAIVYGVFDAAAPWLVVGAALCGIAAVKENWALFATAIAITALGAGSVFAGPIGVWGILAVGGGAMLAAKAIAQTILLHRA